MTRTVAPLGGCIKLLALWAFPLAGAPRELRVGVAGHAFDHLGAIGDQAEAAAASGADIIYVTGLGGLGYMGLPPAEALPAMGPRGFRKITFLVRSGESGGRFRPTHGRH